jgi:hypothetical protein
MLAGRSRRAAAAPRPMDAARPRRVVGTLPVPGDSLDSSNAPAVPDVREAPGPPAAPVLPISAGEEVAGTAAMTRSGRSVRLTERDGFPYFKVGARAAAGDATPHVPLGGVAAPRKALLEPTGEADAHRMRIRERLLARMSSPESAKSAGEFAALYGPVSENESCPVSSGAVDVAESSRAAGTSQHRQGNVSQQAPSPPRRGCAVARSERAEAYQVAAAKAWHDAAKAHEAAAREWHEASKGREVAAKAFQEAAKVYEPESSSTLEATKVEEADSHARRANLAAVVGGDSSIAGKLITQLDQGRILLKVEPKAASSESAPVADEKHAVLKLPERTTSTPEACCCTPLLLRQGPSSSSPARIRASNRYVPQKPIDRPDHESKGEDGRSMATSAGTNHAVASSLGVRGPPPAYDLRIDSKRAQELLRKKKKKQRASFDGSDRAFHCHIENAVAAPSGESSQESRR